MAKPTIAELQEQLTETIARMIAAEGRVAQLAADLSSANERADQERKGRYDAEEQVGTLEATCRELSGSLRAYKGSASKARGTVTMLRRELSPQSRPIGAMKPVRDDDEAAARRDAVRAAIAAGPTELVFSDGRKEIRELAPLAIAGSDAWRDTPRGVILNAEPLLEPGTCQRQELPLAGFALLDESGDQVGYCELPSPLTIASGTRVQIPLNSICF